MHLSLSLSLSLNSRVLNHEVSAFAACPLLLVLSLSLYVRLTRVVQTTSRPALFAWSIVIAEQRGTNPLQTLGLRSVLLLSTETIRTIKDGEPRTAPSTFTQLPSSAAMIR